MKQRLLTPGPTPLPEETLLEMAKPVIYHRAPEFRRIMAAVLEDLQYVCVFLDQTHQAPVECS